MFGQEVNSAVVKPAQTLTVLAKNGELGHVLLNPYSLSLVLASTPIFLTAGNLPFLDTLVMGALPQPG